MIDKLFNQHYIFSTETQFRNHAISVPDQSVQLLNAKSLVATNVEGGIALFVESIFEEVINKLQRDTSYAEKISMYRMLIGFAENVSMNENHQIKIDKSLLTRANIHAKTAKLNWVEFPSYSLVCIKQLITY